MKPESSQSCNEKDPSQIPPPGYSPPLLHSSADPADHLPLQNINTTHIFSSLSSDPIVLFARRDKLWTWKFNEISPRNYHDPNDYFDTIKLCNDRLKKIMNRKFLLTVYSCLSGVLVLLLLFEFSQITVPLIDDEDYSNINATPQEDNRRFLPLLIVLICLGIAQYILAITAVDIDKLRRQLHPKRWTLYNFDARKGNPEIIIYPSVANSASLQTAGFTGRSAITIG
jgi:hypothetical protein